MTVILDSPSGVPAWCLSANLRRRCRAGSAPGRAPGTERLQIPASV